MKKLFPYIIFILILAVVIVAFWRRPVPASNEAKKSPESAQFNILLQGTNEANQTNLTSAHAKIPTGSSLSPTNATLKSITEKFIQQQQGPISFYGQCIDQNSNPVAGVDIEASVQQLTFDPTAEEMVGAKQIGVKLTSDINGRFEITGVVGTGFGIILSPKNGYMSSSKSPKSFGQNSGSYENPIVFRMWKKGGSQKLISHYISRMGIPVDGQPVQFDLLNGNRVTSGGQFIVSCKRDPLMLPSGNSRYNWSVILQVPNGGLITNNDEFMYLAPEVGYEEAYAVEMDKAATNWTRTLDQQFYIKLENGDYGNLIVHLPTFHSPPPIVLTFTVTINPCGSQNLEPAN